MLPTLLRHRTLRYPLLASLVAAVLIPAHLLLYVYPAFYSELLEETKENARHTGLHLAEMYLGGYLNRPDEGLPSPHLGHQMEPHLKDFGAFKMKLFSPQGRVLYSSDAREIGSLNEHAYFKDKVTKGEIYLKVVDKGESSAEGEKVSRSVVETYVPLLHEGEFRGALELYFDISARKGRIDALLHRTTLLVIVVPLLLLALVAWLLNRVGQELDHRKRVQARLELARREAESANRAKSEFLATMSHEIRTPMNAIVGMGELLAETPLNTEQRKYTDIFRSAGDSLMSLINDILDLSRVEAGQLELDYARFDLNELIESVIDVVAIRAADKGIELLARVAPDVPPVVGGDPSRLRQILFNLLGNAVKFTREGHVLLEVERHAQQPGVLRFCVTDTGIGVAPENQEMIFAAFTQANTGITREFGGTGLGLAICSRLVKLMGGEIWLESRVGEGSTFSFTAPVTDFGEPRPQPALTEFKGLEVLLINGSPLSNQVLRDMLEAAEVNISHFKDIRHVYQHLAATANAGRPLPLLLLDCPRRTLDGFELVEKLREHTELKEIPVVMLSHEHHSGDFSRATDLGLLYLLKPVKRKELYRAIGKAVQGNHPAAIAPPPQATIPSAPVTPLAILVAEDAEDNRTLIGSYLKHSPHRITWAENGQEALELFTSRGDFDLVLMDIQMPFMDGYEATREIRAWEAMQKRPPTPIVALTAHALEADRVQALAAGCTDHLSKPIKKQTLFDAIAACGAEGAD